MKQGHGIVVGAQVVVVVEREAVRARREKRTALGNLRTLHHRVRRAALFVSSTSNLIVLVWR